MFNKKLTSSKRFWLCPLYAFNCQLNEDFFYPPESINVSQEIQLQLVTPEIKNYFEQYYPNLEQARFEEYVIVLPYTPDKKDSILSEAGNKLQLLVDLVTSFRLCHAGAITPGPLFLTGPSPLAWSDNICKTEVDVGFIEPPEYEFSLSDVPKVNKLMKEIQTHRGHGKKTKALDISLTRFNSAYNGELEDRLIDQMIAFESLYIGDDKELSYKLAIRTAFLLGKRRATVFHDMKKAYALRGQIVHGAKPADFNKLAEIIPKTEEYLRQSLRKFLSLLSKGISAEEIREKLLDENILKNGKTLALME